MKPIAPLRREVSENGSAPAVAYLLLVDMAAHALGFFAVIFCSSAVIGLICGFVCRGRVAVSIVSSVAAGVVLFIALEARFGSADEWSWQHPIASSAYLLGPFLFLVVVPSVGAALLISRLVMRRKVI